jgi:hypothetical protein
MTLVINLFTDHTILLLLTTTQAPYIKASTTTQARHAMNYIFDKAGSKWTVRRTCVDTPGRAYYFQRGLEGPDNVLPGVVGFYAESIDDAKHKLNA